MRISDWSSDVCSSDLVPEIEINGMDCKSARRQDAGVITPEVIQRLVGNVLDHRDAECKVKVTILQLRCETPHCLPQQVDTRHFGDLKYTVAIAEEFIQVPAFVALVHCRKHTADASPDFENAGIPGLAHSIERPCTLAGFPPLGHAS